MNIYGYILYINIHVYNAYIYLKYIFIYMYIKKNNDNEILFRLDNE